MVLPPRVGRSPPAHHELADPRRGIQVLDLVPRDGDVTALGLDPGVAAVLAIAGLDAHPVGVGLQVLKRRFARRHAYHHLARRRPAGIPQLALDAVAGEIRSTVGRGRSPRDREGRWPAWITPATIPSPVSTGRESPGNGNQRSATGPRAVGQPTWGELPRASKLK